MRQGRRRPDCGCPPDHMSDRLGDLDGVAVLQDLAALRDGACAREIVGLDDGVAGQRCRIGRARTVGPIEADSPNGRRRRPAHRQSIRTRRPIPPSPLPWRPGRWASVRLRRDRSIRSWACLQPFLSAGVITSRSPSRRTGSDEMDRSQQIFSDSLNGSVTPPAFPSVPFDIRSSHRRSARWPAWPDPPTDVPAAVRRLKAGSVPDRGVRSHRRGGVRRHRGPDGRPGGRDQGGQRQVGQCLAGGRLRGAGRRIVDRRGVRAGTAAGCWWSATTSTATRPDAGIGRSPTTWIATGSTTSTGDRATSLLVCRLEAGDLPDLLVDGPDGGPPE